MIDLQSVDSLSAEQLREAVRSFHSQVRFKQSVIDKLTHENGKRDLTTLYPLTLTGGMLA
ncbi:MAG: hypothetical protein HS128_02925 [Ideonella sp.]|nr:hypothetical protein [Ideonella sp.]